MADYKRNIFIHNARHFVTSGNRVRGEVKYMRVPVEDIVRGWEDLTN